MAERDVYLVIGGSGFLGRHIVEQLRGRGDGVSVFDIVQRYDDVPFYSGDISNQEQIGDALTKSAATCIIHTASPPHGLDAATYFKVNVDGTRTVIAAAIAHNVRKLVYTSSAGVVFSGADLMGVDERVPFPDQPLDAYNESKATAERLVLDANGTNGLKTVALRPAGIFGPGDRQVMHGIYQVLENHQTHWQIGDNTNVFDFTYVGNVADAHVLAADKLSSPLESFPTKEDVAFQPLKPLGLTTGERPIPTSKKRPIGPVMEPPTNAEELLTAYTSPDAILPEERPVVRSRFDQYSADNLAVSEKDAADTQLRVDGEAFFITNGEPVYFWDFTRAIWRALGDPFTAPASPPPPGSGQRPKPPPRPTVMPRALGVVLASLAELAAWMAGREAALTRFRVTHACCTKWHNIEKARRVLGYEPKVGMQEGVERMVEWWKAEQAKKQSARSL